MSYDEWLARFEQWEALDYEAQLTVVRDAWTLGVDPQWRALSQDQKMQVVEALNRAKFLEDPIKVTEREAKLRAAGEAVNGAIVALIRHEIGVDPLTTPADAAMTAYARQKIAQVPAAAARLRRSSRRSASKNAIAVAIEVDRGTLNEWIRRGWLEWPPKNPAT